MDNKLEKFKNLFQKSSLSDFVIVHHKGDCVWGICEDCANNVERIFDRNLAPVIPHHLRCDCYKLSIETIKVGQVSKMGINAPDFWLKAYGVLPDYYITKDEAITKYGWNDRRNTLSGKAFGKMIGGDVYKNISAKLPIKPDRVWYECDVDYETGSRNSKRLYYSNDGLMFYSKDHGITFYQVK